MIIEIKFITITLLICISQFFQLALIGFFLKKIDPKINFLITSVLSYFLIIYFATVVFPEPDKPVIQTTIFNNSILN